jgi:hypothetical protein
MRATPELVQTLKTVAVLSCLGVLGVLWVWLDHSTLAVATGLLSLWLIIVGVGAATTFLLCLAISATSSFSPPVRLLSSAAIALPSLYAAAILTEGLAFIGNLWLACQHGPRLEAWLPTLVSAIFVSQFFIQNRRVQV